MDRRQFAGGIAGAALAASLPARAQPAAKQVVVGMLLPGAPQSPGQPGVAIDAFRRALRGLGYVEGGNLRIEYRWSEGREERFAELASELARAGATVIVTQSTPAARAAKAQTATIPVVMVSVGDPVGAGLVASLARPGGNVTGFSLLDVDLDAKRLDILKEAVPGLARVGILWSANDAGMTLAVSRIDAAARTLGLGTTSIALRVPEDIDGAEAIARAQRVEALLVTVQPFINQHRGRILDVVARLRLPAMYTLRSLVEAGGLMSYGPSIAEQYRRAASYVDKIVHGARPADLPIEQPTTFELLVNLRTARALGLTLPAPLLARADETIE